MVSLSLENQVGDEGQTARLLDRLGDLTLVLGAVARNAAGDDLAALGDEVLQRRLILFWPITVSRSALPSLTSQG